MNIQNVYNADVKAAAPAKPDLFENFYPIKADRSGLENPSRVFYKKDTFESANKRFKDGEAKANAYTWKTPFIKIGNALTWVWDSITKILGNIFGCCSYGKKDASKTDDKASKPKA